MAEPVVVGEGEVGAEDGHRTWQGVSHPSMLWACKPWFEKNLRDNRHLHG